MGHGKIEASRAFYDEFMRSEWDRSIDNRERYDIIFNLIDEIKLTSEKKVIDIGAGTGKISVYICENKVDEVVALDITESESLKKKMDAEDRIRFVKDSLPNTDLPAGYFDVAVFSEVLEHIESGRQFEAIKEIERILKPGGYVVLSTPNPASVYEISRFLALLIKGGVKWPGERDGGQLIENWVTPCRLRDMINNFEIKKEMGSYYLPFLFDKLLPKEKYDFVRGCTKMANKVRFSSYAGLYQYFILKKPDQSEDTSTKVDQV